MSNDLEVKVLKDIPTQSQHLGLQMVWCDDDCVVIKKNVALVFGVWWEPGARIPQVLLRLKKKDGRIVSSP